MAASRGAPWPGYIGAMRVVSRTPHGKLVIDRSVADDADALLALHVAVLAEGRWFVTDPDELLDDVAWVAHRIGELSRRDNCLWLKATLDGALVGWLTLEGGTLRRTRHVARLEVLVSEQARGAGVGRALLAAAVQWAEESPVLRRLTLNVYDDNTRAIGLYRAMGFVDEGARPGEYRERDGRLRGDLLMGREV